MVTYLLDSNVLIDYTSKGFSAIAEKRLDPMHALSDEIADKCITIRRKNPKIKLPDAIIAATAIHHNHVLLTGNLNDFKAIDGLNIDNPKLWKS